MACLYTSGWNLSENCLENNIGGVKTFYIGNFSGITTYTYDANGIITGGTNEASYYTIEQRREVGSFTFEHALTLETGANVYSIGAEMTFLKYQASVRDLVYTMATTESSIIVLNQEGRYFLLGEKNGMNAMTSTGGSGKSFEELNGVTVTFAGKEATGPREMSSTHFGTLSVT